MCINQASLDGLEVMNLNAKRHFYLQKYEYNSFTMKKTCDFILNIIVEIIF